MFSEKLKTLFSIILIIIASVTISFGCLLSSKPIEKFDSSEYVFIGEVTEVISHKYLSSDWESKTLVDAYGIKVKVKEKVNLPEDFASYEVFPLHLTSWCGLAGWKKDELLKQFPVGSKIAVVAKRTTMFDSQLSETTIVLQTSFPNGSITKLESKNKVETSVSSIYNYCIYDADNGSKVPYSLVEFELAKDLWRLEKAESSAEKEEITRRLLFYPMVWSLDFTKIVQREIADEETNKFLIEQWEARKQKILNKK